MIQFTNAQPAQCCHLKAKQQAATTPTQIIKSWSLRRYALLHETHKKSKGQDKMVELSATTRYFYLFPAGCKCLHPPSGSYLWRCCPGTAERGSSSYFYRTQRNWTGSDPASNDHYNTHTYTGAWGGVTVVTIITPITLFLLEVQFSCMQLILSYDKFMTDWVTVT